MFLVENLKIKLCILAKELHNVVTKTFRLYYIIYYSIALITFAFDLYIIVVYYSRFCLKYTVSALGFQQHTQCQ